MRRQDRVERRQDYRYYLLNKPVGAVSARRDEEHPTVMDCFPPEQREGLFPVGRLDRNAQGLMLVTDDGRLNYRLLSPENHVAKTYLLWAAGELDGEKIARLESGLTIKGIRAPTQPASIEVLRTSTLGQIPEPIFENRLELAREHPDMPAFCARLTVTEGKRHQVKRMLRAVDCTVVYLQRQTFGPLKLDPSLQPGQFRPLTAEEVQNLRDV